MSPETALRRALVALWTGDAAVGALIGNRVFDRVPKNPAHPYVEFGETQVIDADADCHERFEIFQTVHVWSRTVGNVETLDIASALRRAVRAGARDGTFNTIGAGATHYTLGNIQHQSTRVFDDPDGLTTHGVVTFHTVIDPQ